MPKCVHGAYKGAGPLIWRYHCTYVDTQALLLELVFR